MTIPSALQGNLLSSTPENRYSKNDSEVKRKDVKLM